ncbi:hypothetical protein NB705_003805 [Xanthomonas sacchari]|nr:hypothetical protein [Xanthomonas sacchari]MCW0466732.1 hypothetical protein [Xanthomonas sacchari]
MAPAPAPNAALLAPEASAGIRPKNEVPPTATLSSPEATLYSPTATLPLPDAVEETPTAVP